MNLSDLTPEILSKLLKLAEEREAIQAKIKAVDAQIHALLSGLPSPTVAKAKVAPKVIVKPVKKRANRGEGKKAVADALENAGPEGASVGDLARITQTGGSLLNALLARLVKEEKVVRVARGHYAWARKKALEAVDPVKADAPAPGSTTGEPAPTPASPAPVAD